MMLKFFMFSSSVNIKNYTIKDIPGSSGRLDVISRCLLSALLGKEGFEKQIQVWVFLDNYGTFIFDSERLNHETIPKNELLLTDNFVDFIRNKDLDVSKNPLSLIVYSEKEIIEVLKEHIKTGFKIYVLDENGQQEIQNTLSYKHIIFIIGNQSGEFINSKELAELNLPRLSLGAQSYLASSVIRLIKLRLISFV